MSVVLLGYHNMGCRALKVLKELEVEVSGVFTHRDSSKENLWFKSLAEMAKGYGIPVYFPDDINEAYWVSLIRDLSPELILSCYFRQMVKEEILSIPPKGAVNLHGSLLPKYRGRCPVNWQLIHGEKVSGVTLHYMVVKADAGDIIGQEAVEVHPRDTAVTLFSKLEDAAERVLRKYIPMLLNSTAPRIPQDHSKATYFGGRRPEDGKIDWSQGADSIYNLIRAVTWPYPGAFCFFNERKLFIWDAEPILGKKTGLPIGSVVVEGDKPLVQTGKGVLRILKASFRDCPPSTKEEDVPRELFQEGVSLA